MSSLKVTGFIIKSKSFFEKDKLVTIFTDSIGLISVLVKGSQTKSFKYGSKIEPLNLVELQIKKGRSFYYLHTIDVIENFLAIKADYNRLMFVYYCYKILLLVCVAGQKNDEIFELLLKTLDSINAGESIKAWHKYFCYHVLKNEGIINVPESEFNYNHFVQSFGSYTGVVPKLPQFIDDVSLMKESV